MFSVGTSGPTAREQLQVSRATTPCGGRVHYTGIDSESRNGFEIRIGVATAGETTTIGRDLYLAARSS